MQVNGIDMTREAYRVSVQDGSDVINGFVPEGLVMEMLGLKRRPGHSEVYRWLETYSGAVETALLKQKTGQGSVSPPFDRISIAEDH